MRCWLLLSALLFAGLGSAADAPFAKVAGEIIEQSEYDMAVNVALRQRYYHGRVDDARLNELRHQVAGELIDRVLLRQEALRRGIRIDDAAIEKEVAHDLGRYRLEGVPEQRQRHMAEMLRRQAREKLLRQALEQQVKAVAEPSDAEVRGYYAAHLDKFTTPPQLRLALILLKVAPSAPVASWTAAQQEAQRLQRKLAAGADFAELAALHSGDASAERGGDLGFVHQGMLASEAQAAVDSLKVAEVTPPLNLLQGVALFKLLERQPQVVNPYERVSERARGLLQRERSEHAWEGMLRALRSKGQFEIFNKEITTKMMWSDVSAAKR